MSQDVHALKSLISLVFSMAIPILKEIKKDGYQWSDLLAFIKSDEFSKYFSEALGDIKDLPAELRDIDIEEGFELVGLSVQKTKDLILTFKGLE
jgi:hypothetical protein